MIKQKYIIYGGTFDPVHLAHICMPFFVLNAIKADKIIYVPCSSPPHKQKETENAFHRKNMLEIALKSKSNALIEDYEIKNNNISYSFKTIQYLKEKYSDVEFWLLMGSDNANSFDKWKNKEEILKIVYPITVSRPNFIIDKSKWIYDIIEFKDVDISSTQLRDKLKNKEYDDSLIKNYLDPNVLKYIIENNLYDIHE